MTKKNSPDYVPENERIATFDNDGTLWCEHPIPVQFAATLDALTQLAKNDPTLTKKPLFKAAVEKDLNWFVPYLNNQRLPELLAMLLDVAAGESQDDFEARISAWLKTANHPRFKKPYTQLIFQPMTELIDYLNANDFHVFIVSGGGMDFVRLFSEKIYGIPRENVVGANLKLAWEYKNGRPLLIRQAGLMEPYCDGAGKPINIQLHIGRPPILACGNTNGDIEMMEFAANSTNPYLNLIIHHDDAEREYSSNHSAELLLEKAKEHQWTVVSVKEDFKTVFP
ncbi:MAG: haloacid dehalogenase-like hydrolase [Candidatus Bathyarchaeota archaeon]|nr:haloacid dehalogenase-like hydrolase [Candidatus Bathyarchaeota archaeon]